MLITIDGHAAAGKSTQSHALAKSIDGHRTNQHFLELRELRGKMLSEKSLTFKDDLYFLFDLIKYKFAESSVDYWRHVTSPIISDEYWLILWERGPEKKYLDLTKLLIPIPDISFYIEITAADSYRRRIFRQHQRDGKTTKLSDIVTPEKYIKTFKERDESDKVFWSWLRSEVSNVHILDGNQSESALTNKMLRILKNDYGIKINSDL